MGVPGWVEWSGPSLGYYTCGREAGKAGGLTLNSLVLGLPALRLEGGSPKGMGCAHCFYFPARGVGLLTGSIYSPPGRYLGSQQGLERGVIPDVGVSSPYLALSIPY